MTNGKISTPFKKPVPAATGSTKPPVTPARAPTPGTRAVTQSAPGRAVAGRLAGAAPAKAPPTLFKGIENARPNFANNWERDGRYFERIDRVKIDANRKGETRVIVEKTVLAVIDAADVALPHRPGEQIAHNMPAKHDAFLGNVKSFALGAMGCEEEEVKEELLWSLAEEDQPLAGTIVEMSNVMITTRAGDPFTKVTYVRPVPAAELKEYLAQADYGARIIERFYKNGALDRMIEVEAEAAGAEQAVTAPEADDASQ